MAKRFVTGATLCWLTAAAALAGVIMLQVNSDISLALPVTAAPAEAPLDEEARTTDAIAGTLTADILDVIVERPIFSWSRRPYLPPEDDVVMETTPEVRELSVKLAGTMLAGKSRLALFTHPSRGLLRLRQGQDVDGWRIEDIREDEVRLQLGDKVTLLRLRKGVPGKSRQPALGATNEPAAGTNNGDETVPGQTSD